MASWESQSWMFFEDGKNCVNKKFHPGDPYSLERMIQNVSVVQSFTSSTHLKGYFEKRKNIFVI